MPQPNMKKEYRAELKSVGKQLQAINRRTDQVYRRHRKLEAALERSLRQQKKAEQKEIKTLARQGARALVRKSILEGRLS